MLLSIAECQARDLRGAAAAGTLRRYLAMREDAPDAASVQARIEGLEAMPGELSVTSTPEGAFLYLNGEAAVDSEGNHQRTPTTLSLMPGDYALTLRAAGFEARSETVAVAFATRSNLRWTLSPEGAAELSAGAAAPDFSAADTGEVGGDVSHAVWIASGVAGAGLLAGTVLGFMALGEQTDFDALPSEEVADHGERLALFADLSFGLAAVAAVSAVVLAVTEEDESDADGGVVTARRGARRPGDPGVSVSLAPSAGPQHFGATSQVRF